MNAQWMPRIIFALALLSASLVACVPETPQLIGSYPAQEQPKPLAQLPHSAPQPGYQFVYETWITLEVPRVTATAERAVELVDRYGGYLESSHSWLQDGRSHMTLVLAVPAAGFDRLRQDLLDLGTLQSEQVSGQWTTPTRGLPVASRLTLTLQPRVVAWSDWTISGWNPGRTFRQALEVFISIFGFLLDIVIWVLVVLGPFVLVALGLRALWRRLR